MVHSLAELLRRIWWINPSWSQLISLGLVSCRQECVIIAGYHASIFFCNSCSHLMYVYSNFRMQYVLVYDESATFTDEIDEYTMDKWIKGTKSLFVPSGSRVSLVGDIDVSTKAVSFRFSEDLMFNIPFKPVCSLSGKVVLERDENTGLITSYREYWDQSVNEVLKTAKFGKKA